MRIYSTRAESVLTSVVSGPAWDFSLDSRLCIPPYLTWVGEVCPTTTLNLPLLGCSRLTLQREVSTSSIKGNGLAEPLRKLCEPSSVPGTHRDLALESSAEYAYSYMWTMKGTEIDSSKTVMYHDVVLILKVMYNVSIRIRHQRINGSTDQRINGSTDQRINGSTDQRINGSTDQRILVCGM